MAKDEEKAEEPAKGGKGKMIIILVAVLALAGGGYFMFLKPSDAAAEPVVLPAPVPGAVIQLDPITINLTGGHFLKLGMALQPTADAAEVNGAKALDIAINEFSGDNIDELATAEGRNKAKAELVARIKLAYLPEVEAAAETSSSSKKKSDDEEDGDSADGEEELSGEDAIAAAEELEVQPLVYDVYFTEFVMQ